MEHPVEQDVGVVAQRPEKLRQLGGQAEDIRRDGVAGRMLEFPVVVGAAVQMVARPGFAGGQVVVDDGFAAARQLQQSPLYQRGEPFLLVWVALQELLDHAGLLDLVFYAVLLGEVHVFQDLQLLQIGVGPHHLAAVRCAEVIRKAPQPAGVHVVFCDKIQLFHGLFSPLLSDLVPHAHGAVRLVPAFAAAGVVRQHGVTAARLRQQEAHRFTRLGLRPFCWFAG